MSVTVHMPLRNEGVDVWRPVEAEDLGNEQFRIITVCPKDETWQFATGDIVRCQNRMLSGGRRLVACERV